MGSEVGLTESWRLKLVDWVSKFPTEEVEALRNASIQRNYEPGATVFTPEDRPTSVYLLEQGLVRIYRLSGEGDETTFGYVAPGEIFGELSLFGDFPRESFAMAVRRSHIWRIPVASFRKLLESHATVAMDITRQIGQRMKRMESRVESLVFRDVRTRLARILLELAEDFGREREDAQLLDLDLTQSELAKLVGSTRQTVNSSLGELETLGLIQREGRRLVILKPNELARFTRTPG